MWTSSYDLRPQSLYTHQEILTTDIEESAVSVLRTLSGAKRLSTLSACDFPRYSAVSIIDLVTEMSKTIMVSKSVSLILSPVSSFGYNMVLRLAESSDPAEAGGYFMAGLPTL